MCITYSFMKQAVVKGPKTFSIIFCSKKNLCTVYKSYCWVHETFMAPLYVLGEGYLFSGSPWGFQTCSKLIFLFLTQGCLLQYTVYKAHHGELWFQVRLNK